MGKGPSVDFPEPPDPAAVAGAQAQANTGSAVATALLNLIDTQSPLGSVTFERIGGQQAPPAPPLPQFPGFNLGDFRGGVINPSGSNFSSGLPSVPQSSGLGNQNLSGDISIRIGDQTVTVPRFRRVTELAPEAQQQLEQQQQLGNQLTDLALFNTGRVRDVQQNAFDPDLPGLTSDLAVRQTPGLADTQDVQTGFNAQTDPLLRPQDFGDEAQRLERAIFDRQLSLLDPIFDQSRTQQNIDLTNRGLPVGSEPRNIAEANLARTQNQVLSEAANQAVGQGFQLQQNLADLGLRTQGQQFGQQLAGFQTENQARQQALAQALQRGGFELGAQQQEFGQAAQAANLANQARSQAFQEQAFQRNLPINEIAALLGTAPGVQLPQGIAPTQPGINAPDIAGAIFNSAQLQQDQALAALQANAGLGQALIGAGGNIGAGIFSDASVKADIIPIMTLPNNIPIVSFRFIGSDRRHIGVIAQDVEKIIPAAVIDGPIKRVDYEKVL